jgi:succinate dehydrogenase/fumarate reductase flavoprotein subunit
MTFVAVLGKEAWKTGVQLLDGIMIAKLLVDNGRVLGAIGIDRAKKIYTFSAGAVVLAAGGANRIYPNVVPRISHDMYGTTGDGFALALHAGLSLVDMEFANFRDTPPAAGFRGTYINAKGEPFMAKYDPLWKEKAPRGKVVEAIFREMQAGRGPIYIEIDNESERAAEILPEEYKSYVRFCKEGKPPPVTITFQRLLGGARINPDASSEIGGLYIAGENAGGFHGADRLQGAAFLETQVFGRFAGVGAAEFTHNKKRKKLSESLVKNYRDKVFKNLDREEDPKRSEILKKIHKLTWTHASIVRDAEGLKRGLSAIEKLREELSGDLGCNGFEVLEVKNLALTAEIVMRAALARQETRGTHLRSDFPGAKEEMARRHINVCYKKDGEIEAKVVPSRS